MKTIHRLTAFGIVTAPPALTTTVLVAGRRLRDFTRRWRIVVTDSGWWRCQRA